MKACDTLWLPKLRKLSICGRQGITCEALFRLMIGLPIRLMDGLPEGALIDAAKDGRMDDIQAAQKALLDQTNLPLLTLDIRHNNTLNNDYTRARVESKCRELPGPDLDLSKLIGFIDDDTQVSADEVELCADGDPGRRAFQRYPGVLTT